MAEKTLVISAILCHCGWGAGSGEEKIVRTKGDKKYRFEEEKIAELQEMKWWNRDEDRLRSLVGKEALFKRKPK